MGKGYVQNLHWKGNANGQEIYLKSTTFLAIRKCKLKLHRFYLATVTVAKIKNTSNNKFWWGCGGKGTHIPCWGDYKLVQSLWKVYRFLRKLRIKLWIDFIFPLIII